MATKYQHYNHHTYSLKQFHITISPRTLAIVPATFNSIPKPNCHYSFMEPSVLYESQQNLFAVSVLKIFAKVSSTPTVYSYKYKFLRFYSA